MRLLIQIGKIVLFDFYSTEDLIYFVYSFCPSVSEPLIYSTDQSLKSYVDNHVNTDVFPCVEFFQSLNN